MLSLSYQQERGICQECRSVLLGEKSQSGTTMTLYTEVIVTQIYTYEILKKVKGYIAFIFSFVYEREKKSFVRSPILRLPFSHQSISFFERNVQLYQASIYNNKL